MVWYADDTQLVTINLILEGFGTIVSHTFPAVAHINDIIFGTVTIRNDGDEVDDFRVVITRQDDMSVILDDTTLSLAQSGTYTTVSSIGFTMPATSLNLLIETYHDQV